MRFFGCYATKRDRLKQKRLRHRDLAGLTVKGEAFCQESQACCKAFACGHGPRGTISSFCRFGLHGSQEFGIQKLLRDCPGYFVFNVSVTALRRLPPLHTDVGL